MVKSHIYRSRVCKQLFWHRLINQFRYYSYLLVCDINYTSRDQYILLNVESDMFYFIFSTSLIKQQHLHKLKNSTYVNLFNIYVIQSSYDRRIKKTGQDNMLLRILLPVLNTCCSPLKKQKVSAPIFSYLSGAFSTTQTYKNTKLSLRLCWHLNYS